MAKFTRAEIRKILGDNCNDEIENALIASHLGVVDALKDEMAQLRAEAAKLPGVQKELDGLKAAKDSGKDWESKYNDLKKDFDAYKTDAEKKDQRRVKTAAYRELLKKIGISDKRIESVLKVSDVDGVKLTDDGSIDGADDLEKSLKAEWADFIQTSDTHAAKTATPPRSTGATLYKSKDEIMAIKDTSARQRAIAENINLFKE